MWESQVLLTDGQVVFLRVLRFSPTFDERSARYKWNILERAVKPKSKKKKKKDLDLECCCVTMQTEASVVGVKALQVYHHQITGEHYIVDGRGENEYL